MIAAPEKFEGSSSVGRCSGGLLSAAARPFLLGLFDVFASGSVALVGAACGPLFSGLPIINKTSDQCTRGGSTVFLPLAPGQALRMPPASEPDQADHQDKHNDRVGEASRRAFPAAQLAYDLGNPDAADQVIEVDGHKDG